MNSSTKVHIVYLSIIVLLVVVMTGGFFYFKRSSHMQVVMGMNTRQGMLPPGGKSPNGQKGMGSGMGMMALVTPPALSEQQQQQLVAGASASSTQKTFNITAGNYYFVPNKVTVNKGDNVTLVITNAGGFH